MGFNSGFKGLMDYSRSAHFWSLFPICKSALINIYFYAIPRVHSKLLFSKDRVLHLYITTGNITILYF